MAPDILPSLSTQKQYRDHITAHKIALLAIIKEYCAVEIEGRTIKPYGELTDFNLMHSSKQNRDISITLLKLIQNPDMPLKELIKMIEPILHSKVYERLLEKLKELRTDGIDGVKNYIQALEPLLIDAMPTQPVVHKSSMLGLFIRRMLLAFDKLSFCHVIKLCQKYYSYYDSAFGDTIPSDDSMDADSKLVETVNRDEEFSMLASQKQAEFFLAQQAALLQINENAALPPKDLQIKIRELLKGNSSLTEAHYLSFLNTLRVKEFCGAMENLYHHFDRNTSLPLENKVTPGAEDTSRSFRYAALNLAILHARSGHRKEALAALKEAIMVAQEVNDNVCLQHALTWLYRLCPENNEILVERSVSKSGELSLWYLSSLGIQSLAKMKSVTTSTPITVLDLVMKGDILNCQHSMTEVMGTAYSLRAGLWSHYGNSCMTNLISQLLLHLNTSDPIRGGVYNIGEGYCIALCNLATAFALEGEYNFSKPILSLAQQLFPSHSEYSHLWKLCDLYIKFDKAINCGRWVDAGKLVAGIKILDAQEAKYRAAQLQLSQGNLAKCYDTVTELINDCDSKDLSPHFRVRVLLIKASLLCRMPNYAAAVSPIMTCLELCKSHHLIYLQAHSTLYLASVQLLLGLPNKAIQILETVFIAILTHGSAYDKGCCYMLYAKAVALSAQQGERPEKDKRSTLLSAASMCNPAVYYFQKVQAIHKAKYCLCWQAHLYDQLNLIGNRNFSARQFSTLDQQYPSTNCSSIMIP